MPRRLLLAYVMAVATLLAGLTGAAVARLGATAGVANTSVLRHPVEAPDPSLPSASPSVSPSAASASASASTTARSDTWRPAPGAPSIDVWYGSPQSFGPAQTWVNVLGRVTDPDGVSAVSYQLNDGVAQALSLGPDRRRLQHPGDVNVDIPYADLRPGRNTVTLVATDRTGRTSTRTVQVIRSGEPAPSLPHRVDWDPQRPLTDQAQPVDGLWSTGSGDLKTGRAGYDRLVAVGSRQWQDYEATVPFTVHDFAPGAFSRLSGAPMVGVGVHWQGHTARDEARPAWGWYPTGAFAWYRFYERGGRFELTGNEGRPKAYVRASVATDINYVLKVRAVTTPDGVRYSMKVWRARADEPPQWAASITEPDGPGRGSLLLIAHQVDATFGTVTVAPV